MIRKKVCEATKSSHSDDWEYKEYCINGQLWVICNYINDKIEGEYKSYWDNGQLWVICNYINGLLEGECKSYNLNGQLYEHIVYENDKLIKTIKGSFIYTMK